MIAIINKLNGNILTYNESEDSYYIQHGADAVPKKLGNVGITIPRLDAMQDAGGYTGFASLQLNVSDFKRVDIEQFVPQIGSAALKVCSGKHYDFDLNETLGVLYSKISSSTVADISIDISNETFITIMFMSTRGRGYLSNISIT